MVETALAAPADEPSHPLRLDLGCGINKKDGFTSVDIIAFEGVDVVCDLTKSWPWKDGSVTEINASHVVEHFTAEERCHFMNEAYRVLVTPELSIENSGKLTVVCPYWASCRAYGDPTHKWPPVGEFFPLYCNKEWRSTQAPHTDKEHLDWGYDCDFDHTAGYMLDNDIAMRSAESQQFATKHYKEACSDIMITFIKRVITSQ